MTNPVKLRERISVKALEISLEKYGSSDYLSMVKQSVAIADAMVAELEKPRLVDAEFLEVEESSATEKVMVSLDDVIKLLYCFQNKIIEDKSVSPQSCLDQVICITDLRHAIINLEEGK